MSQPTETDVHRVASNGPACTCNRRHEVVDFVHTHAFNAHRLTDGRTIEHCPSCGTTRIDGREWPGDPDPGPDGDVVAGLVAAFALMFIVAAVVLAVFVRPWSLGHLVGCPALLGTGALLLWLVWSRSDR